MRLSIVSVLFVISLILLSMAGSSPLPAANGPRNLIVYFEFLDNTNGVEEAVEYLFNQMLGPGDQLLIQSPAQLYGFSRATLSRPKAELIAMIQEKLRADIAQTAQGYKQVIKDLEVAAGNIGVLAYPSGAPSDGANPTKDMSELFILYRQGLTNLNQLRQVNDAILRRLAGAFHGQKGENHLIVLFERELRPIPIREALNALADTPVFAMQSNELFSTGNLKEPFDVAALANFFKEVPLTQHFIYITSKTTSATGNLFENSGDTYAAFSKIAKTTGGACETTSEPVAGLEAIMRAWKGTK
jgi:hypothetical protein